MRRLAPVALVFVLFVPCAGAWTWPVQGPLLETFSFDPAHPYAAGQHRGIAIRADGGTPVVAPAAGVVTFAGTVAANGKTVTIETSAGLALSLTHLGSLAVKENDTVAEGAVVGSVGPSGTPEFDVPYVHFGIRDASKPQGYLDPLGFLPAAGSPPPPPAPAATPPPAPASPAQTPAAAPPPPVAQTPAPGPAPPPLVQTPAPTPAPATPPQAPAPAPPAAPGERPAAAVAPQAAAASPQTEQEPAAPPLELVSTAPAAKPALDAEPSRLLARDETTGTEAARALLSTPAEPALAPERTIAGPLSKPVAPVRHRRADARRPPAMPVAPPPEAPPARPHPRSHRPAFVAPPSATPVARVLAIALAAVLALAAAAITAVRMIKSPSPTREGASSAREDPRCASLAVREWPAPHRPRGGLRRAGRRVRPLSPLERQRRPDGERDGRARHARDGLRRSKQRLAA
jgi:Peptidase family M23